MLAEQPAGGQAPTEGGGRRMLAALPGGRWRGAC